MPDDDFPKANCWVCSPRNPQGLGLEVDPAPDGEGVVASWRAPEHLVGPPGILHGGLQGALLDDMAVWAVHEAFGTLPLTRRYELEFHRPVPVDEPLLLRAEIVEADGSDALVAALLTVDGEMATEGTFRMRVLAEA